MTEKYSVVIASDSAAIQGLHKGQRSPPLDCHAANAPRSDGETGNNAGQAQE